VVDSDSVVVRYKKIKAELRLVKWTIESPWCTAVMSAGFTQRVFLSGFTEGTEAGS
jgi:hypothetical protein